MASGSSDKGKQKVGEKEEITLPRVDSSLKPSHPVTRKLRQRITKINADKDSFSKQLIEHALEGNIEALIGYVLQNRLDFDIMIKDHVRQAFSDWTYETVMRFFGMDKLDTSYVPPSACCPEYLARDIVKQYKRVAILRGDPETTGEKGREKFIDVVLNTICGDLACFTIKDEGQLSGVIAYGNVEYVFRSGSGLIGLILEAKKEDIRQGYGQLFIEMFTAHRMNIACGFVQNEFYGILSTAETWYFVEYVRGRIPPFRSSKGFYLRLDDDVLFSRLLNTFYAFILNAWLGGTDLWRLRASSVLQEVENDDDPSPNTPRDANSLEGIVTSLAKRLQIAQDLFEQAKHASSDSQAQSIMDQFVASIKAVKDHIHTWDVLVAPFMVEGV